MICLRERVIADRKEGNLYPQLQYASFLVRLWRVQGEDEGETSFKVQSKIEHIQSGKIWTFNSLEELDAFLLEPPKGYDELAWVNLPEAEPSSAPSENGEM